MRAALVTCLVSATALVGCATTTAPTEQELALRAELDATSIVPATRAERDAVRSQDLLTQAAFWAEAYELNPSDREASLELAIILRHIGNPARSAEVARQALALYPDHGELLFAYGTAMAANGRGAAAIEPLTRASQSDPTDWRMLNALGVALEQAGQSDRAQSTLRDAMRFAPGEPSVMSNLAMSYALSGEAGTAERLLREAMIRPGADSTVRQNLALVMALQGRFDEAEDMARVDVSPEMAEANMAYIRSMLTSQRRYDAVAGR